MKKIIVITNQKGGVGKTTTALSLIDALHLRGYNVLGVDLDPQASLGFGVGVDIENADTVYDVLTEKKQINDVIVKTKLPRGFICLTTDDSTQIQYIKDVMGALTFVNTSGHYEFGPIILSGKQIDEFEGVDRLALTQVVNLSRKVQSKNSQNVLRGQAA